MQDWAALEIHERNRGAELRVDAMVGVRVDPVERLLAQILGERTRRRTPTYVRRLSLLHYEGTSGIRSGGSPWPFNAPEKPERVAADFANAFESSARPFLERVATLDALAAEMTEGRVDGETAWRLPVLHLLRGDTASAREVLEQGTRWMARAGRADAYREFALEMVRRLGDATIVESPSEELVSVLRPALRDAFPDRAGPILAALVRSFWWEPHPKSGDNHHCAFCGATDVEADLFGSPLRICDTCVAASRVMLVDPLATGASRWVQTAVPGGRIEMHPTPAPTGVSAAGFAADAVRALRGSVDEAERYVAQVERRLLGAPADRDPSSVCVACGPLRAPRSRRYEWTCSYCGNYLYDEASVECGRASICEDCVTGMYERVAEDRRLT